MNTDKKNIFIELLFLINVLYAIGVSLASRGDSLKSSSAIVIIFCIYVLGSTIYIANTLRHEKRKRLSAILIGILAIVNSVIALI